MSAHIATLPKIVLIGLESVGKSALFRSLTGEAVGDEINVRGSTTTARAAPLIDRSSLLIDTPGIRVQDDSETTRVALREINSADTVVLVARGTHAKTEIDTLLREMNNDLRGRKVALIITFEDRAAPEIQQLKEHYQQHRQIPVALANARNMTADQRKQVLQTIHSATPLQHEQWQPMVFTPDIPVIKPPKTIFEDRVLGPWISLLTIAVLFATPVYLAYIFADWLQPRADNALITPLIAWLTPLEKSLPLLSFVLVGDYGVITLGWYSFLWAFPVVLLIGISVAITEEIGLKDRITAALDPWLRVIGLNGRDLVPVLSGFGCNVVAVFQSRSCSSCTRKACISLIAFGSACSYQIGASLSLFNVGGAPWLFAPYLAVLFLVGAIHTRIWNPALTNTATLPLNERAFLQRPTLRGVWWRVRAVVQQFIFLAIPIFLLVCVAGALLAYFGIMDMLAHAVAPALSLFGLPASVAPGIIFSIVRKDGLLILNQGEGALLAILTTGQLFVLVYLASTLTACLVTLWTIRTELGLRYALTLAARQALTALVSAFIISIGIHWLT